MVDCAWYNMAAMDEVSQIRQKIDIVSIISEHLPLKKLGRNFKVLCPFHTEKTPSFVVSPERQIWHCFGCGEGGDVFTFLMKYENIDFPEALRILAKRAGVTLSSRNFLSEGTGKKKERLYEANHLASEFYHYILTQHEKGKLAREYLQRRGTTPQAINLFKLGFAPSAPNALTRYLTEKKGFSQKELEEAGITIKVQNYIDRFRNRIMFPLTDHRGNIVGFSGRILTEGSPSASSGAKYVNTPETLVYHKGDNLFGLYQAKDIIKKKRSALIVEGEFDMIQSFIHGIENTVAIKGTALTDGQASLLKRFSEKVVICLDQDAAGIDATFRGVGVLENKGILINVVVLPQGKDPDESLRQNPKLFLDAVKREVPVYDFLLQALASRFNSKTTEGKKRMGDEFLPFLARIQNEIIKDHYVKKLASELSVSSESIVREMEKYKKAQAVGVSKPETLTVLSKRSRREILEEYLIALIIQSDNVIERFQEARNILDTQELETPIYQKIFLLLEECLKNPAKRKKKFSIKRFMKRVPEELHFAIDTCYLFALPVFSSETGEDETRLLLEIEKTATEIKALSIRSKMQNLTLKMREEENLSADGAVKQNEERLTRLKEEFNTLIETLRVLTVQTISPQP